MADRGLTGYIEVYAYSTPKARKRDDFLTTSFISPKLIKTFHHPPSKKAVVYLNFILTNQGSNLDGMEFLNISMKFKPFGLIKDVLNCEVSGLQR
jgi:hypothetical protein